MSSWVKRLLTLSVFIALLGGGLWALLNYQNLVDRYVVATFQPSSKIKSITDSLELTDDGEFYFFAAQPELNDRSDFNKNCQNRDKESIILGCFVTPQNIFVFNIDDERLAGVKEVTSAHEMLHVAYDRLDYPKRQQVDELLQAELSKINDEKMQKRLAVYEKTEPGEKFNELHSIIGTEISGLSPELEEYYGRYFKDRHAIAKIAAEYEQLFRQLEQEQGHLVSEIDALAAEINQRVKGFNARIGAFNSDISRFNQKAGSGDFESEADFNAARSDLMARQSQLEGEQAAIEQLEKIYDQKRAKLEALNSEAESLNRTIDSRLEPVPSI